MILNDCEKKELGSENLVKEDLNKRQHGDSDVMEAVLSHVGEMGRYQKWLFLAMLPFGFIATFVGFVQMFVAATPQRHWCKVPELEHLDMELRRNLTAPGASSGVEWQRCATFKANWSQVLETLLPPESGTPTVPCANGWEFELRDIPYHTVVSERGWLCEYAANAPIAQAMFFAGSFVGGLLFGWLADRFGRVPALVGSNLLGFVGGVATIFTTGLWDFAVSRFLVGMCLDSCFMLMYILRKIFVVTGWIVLEYVGPRHRTWVASSSIALYIGVSSMLLPWIAVWIGDWRRLLLVTSLPMLVVIAVPFLVPESARWLSSRGRVNQVVKVLRRFERVNGTKIPQNVMDKFIDSSRQTRQTDESLTALFKSGPLRTMMVLMVIVYMSCALIFDGLVRMSESMGFDFFITFTLTSATEIPSVFLLGLILDRWGRRILTCIPLATAATLTLIAAFVPKGFSQVSLAILARFCVNMAYTAALQWATELLPTGLRASASSMIRVSSYAVVMLSPFIVYSERYWAPLSLLILSAIACAGSIMAAFLPETRARPMPQTIADCERLVQHYSLCGKADPEVKSEEWTTNQQKSTIK